uniref:Uncharacterized protein n=1 Tax=Oryza sativa subsp. japonica TaxID=39947 RepID=Q75I21_ORYSJ|nr:hypothetical protein [Oryza sativa Japonica Group]
MEPGGRQAGGRRDSDFRRLEESRHRDAVRRTADAGGLVGGGAVRTAASEETRSRREPETKHHA